MRMRMAFILLAMLTIAGLARAESVGVSQNEINELTERIGRDEAWEKFKSQHTLRPPEGMGFMWPGNPSLPAPVSRAADSVFAIAVPGAGIGGVENPQAFIEEVKALPTEQADDIDKTILIDQLQNCIREKTEDCRVFMGNSRGSAFLTGGGRELRTALHELIELAEETLKSGRNQNLPIYLLRDGKVVAGPDQLKARFQFLNPEAVREIGQKFRDRGDINLDQVLLRLDHKIAPGIEFAENSPKAGDKLFIIGVPRKTYDRVSFQATDADGKSVWISAGTAMDAIGLRERWRAILGEVREGDEKFIAAFQGIGLTADSAPALSGGAIVNEQGELVGLYTNGTPGEGAAFSRRMSLGVRKFLGR